MKMSGLTKTAMGIVGYAFLEGTIDSAVNQFAGNLGGLGTNGVQLVLGYYLMKRKGIVGGIGKAMFTINAYQLAKGMVGSGFNLLGSPVAVGDGF